MQTGTALLDSKFKIFNEKVPCENSNGGDHLGLGSSLPGKNNQGNLVKSGTSLAHKSFWTSSSKTSSDQIYKVQERKFISFPNSQHNSSGISIKNGGDQKWENDGIT